MKCIAVDDEPMALGIVEKYINKVPFLELEKSFRDSLDALDFLQKNQVDLIFLDINMPDLSGIQFLRSLTSQPLVIFITAYSEYALQSYDYQAVDYLLKPVEFDRFLKAANRAMKQFKLLTSQDSVFTPSEKDKKDYVIIKSGAEMIRIKNSDIHYVESAGNYVIFFTENQKIMSLMNMKEVLSMLPSSQFSRIHRSYVVAFRHIDLIERHQVTINKRIIPIGSIYRESFIEKISK